MKNGSTTITQKRGNHEDHLAMLQHRQPSRIFMFMEKNSCCVFDGISLVSCIMSCSNRDHYWGSLPNTIDEIEPSTQGKTRPLLLQAWQNYSPASPSPDNARSHVAAPVKRYLETLKWEVLPHPYSPDIAPSDYHLFRSTYGSSSHHMKISKIVSMIG